jgi:DNA primase
MSTRSSGGARRGASRPNADSGSGGRGVQGVPNGEALERATLARLQAVHQTLTRAVADLAQGDAWQRMLRIAARFHHYSPHNVLLITAQCPDAQAVAGYQTWKQLERQVRKGEKGIAILAPVVRRRPEGRSDGAARPDVSTDVRDAALNSVDTKPAATADDTTNQAVGTAKARRLAGFRVVHVFDISQTDGPPLPPQPLPELLDGQAPAGLREALVAQVVSEGYRLAFEPLTIPHPGLAGANGVTDYFARSVTVKPDLPVAQTVKTLAHELGHVLLHAPEHRPATLTREQAEVEAESVAYVVGAAHGLDTSSYTIPYVTGWASGDLDLVRATAERVLATARRVLEAAVPGPAFELHDIGDGGRTLDRTVERTVTAAAVTAPSRDLPSDVPTPPSRSSTPSGSHHASKAAHPAEPAREVVDLTYADQPTHRTEAIPDPAEHERRPGQQLLFRCEPEDPAGARRDPVSDALSDALPERGSDVPDRSDDLGGRQR